MSPDEHSTLAGKAAIDEDTLWRAILALGNEAKLGQALSTRTPVSITGDQVALRSDASLAFYVDPDAPRGWSWPDGTEDASDSALSAMLDLYLPLCVGKSANDLVVAHLGQSLDGRIATQSGNSQFITGEENLVHTHRMRALFDAVVVGASTASTDNPRLTTRLASGDHATRVVVDPRCSVDPENSIFTDGAAETLVICDQSFVPPASDSHIGLRLEDGKLTCASILQALAQRGLRRVFIEGGGITVSRFLQSGLLNRLHVCVAPMIIGSGRPAFRLTEVDALSEGTFLDAKHFTSGRDMLFDCQLRGSE